MKVFEAMDVALCVPLESHGPLPDTTNNWITRFCTWYIESLHSFLDQGHESDSSKNENDDEEDGKGDKK